MKTTVYTIEELVAMLENSGLRVPPFVRESRAAPIEPIILDESSSRNPSNRQNNNINEEANPPDSPNRQKPMILDKFHKPPTIADYSRAWFWMQDKLNSLRKINDNQLFNEIKSASKIIPGRMYLYVYDPKTKASLPYYDTFPLVLPFDMDATSFIGLNLHYLDYYNRVQLLDRLMQYATDRSLTDATRIKYTWAMIANAAQFRLAKYCIKRYLFTHVRSRLLEIPPQEWFTVTMLPISRFHGASNRTVWKNAR